MVDEMYVKERPASHIVIGKPKQDAMYLVLKMMVILDMLDDSMIELENKFAQKDKAMTKAYKKHMQKRFGADIAWFYDIDLENNSEDMENIKKLVEDDIRYYIKARENGKSEI